MNSSCGKGGNAYQYLTEYTGLTKEDALEKLGQYGLKERIGTTPPRSKHYKT